MSTAPITVPLKTVWVQCKLCVYNYILYRTVNEMIRCSIDTLATCIIKVFCDE